MLGFDPRRTIYFLRGLPAYYRDFRILKQQHTSAATQFPFGRLHPCLEDRFNQSGLATGHYFHQDLLVARRVHLSNPAKHVDVGSRVDGFVAHIASFRQNEVLDIHPLPSTIPNVTFTQADLMAPLSQRFENYCDSLSCLHALEHFGLGRYGDAVNYDGYLLGLDNLRKLLRPGGVLYLSVPIGPRRIEFNAHRVFSMPYLSKYLSALFHLERFSFVDDQGLLHENVSLTDPRADQSFQCEYGCGIFAMTRS